ncbi:helix-turn-helix domain-containing protein [Candidatus Dojkabacteria bacterium]|nr:helix-turn-helix domain-containing protein [Candidatus Dojkabacteria bacterium]
MKKKSEEGVYTVAEVSEFLKVHWQTVLNYIKSGKLKAIKLGNGYRIPKKYFEEFIEDNLAEKKNV